MRRKDYPPIKVYLTPDERKEIELKAKESNLSLSAFMRNVCLDKKMHTVADYEHVKEVAKINADQGRLGGLLKMWLSNDAKVKHFDHKVIFALLARIEKTQKGFHEIMKKIAKEA